MIRHVDSDWLATSPPAKVNLFLEILGRRDDGFHRIDTIMVPIDWRDELRIRPRPTPGVDLRVAWLPDAAAVATELRVAADDPILAIPTDSRNLVARALDQVSRRTGYDGGWQAVLGKRIPAGAGMGGASSDAASAIAIAMRWLGREDPELMHSIAASIGSDVPFFLKNLAAGRATSRGEHLVAVELTTRLDLVVVYPPESVSTAAVYGQLGLPVGADADAEQLVTPDAMMRAMAAGDVAQIGSALHNRLRGAAGRLSPRVAEALQWLAFVGLDRAQMTGSGSACFGVAANADDADRKAREMSRDVRQGALIRSVASCDVPARIVNA